MVIRSSAGCEYENTRQRDPVVVVVVVVVVGKTLLTKKYIRFSRSVYNTKQHGDCDSEAIRSTHISQR